MNTAVLDIGKTNVKFAVFDPAGQLLFERQIPNNPLPGPPYPHMDVVRIWEFLGAALRQACQSFQIDTLVPTTHGATGALIGDEGLVLPIMDYEFGDLKDIAPRYAKMRDSFDRSFSPDMAVGLNWGRQLAWQKWHYGEDFDRATAILAYPQYWAWALTGVKANDICSLGCHTDLWLPLENKPSHLAEAFGVAQKFAAIRPPWQVLGDIRSSVKEEFGISSNIKVLCGIHDSNASLLPYLGARHEPLTVLSTGTWVVAMAIGHSLSSLRQDLDMNANIDVFGRPTACARFMGGREFAAIAGDCTENATPNIVEELMRAEVFALPSFSANGGPYAKMQGRIVGCWLPHQRSSLATLYCALMSCKILDNLEVTEGDVIVEGSFARDPVFASLLAGLRPKQKIFVSAGQASTARGAAMLAHWPPNDMSAATTEIAPVLGPQLRAYYAQWLDLVAA